MGPATSLAGEVGASEEHRVAGRTKPTWVHCRHRTPDRAGRIWHCPMAWQGLPTRKPAQEPSQENKHELWSLGSSNYINVGSTSSKGPSLYSPIHLFNPLYST